MDGCSSWRAQRVLSTHTDAGAAAWALVVQYTVRRSLRRISNRTIALRDGGMWGNHLRRTWIARGSGPGDPGGLVAHALALMGGLS
jgi:hypothetical protein